MKQVFRILALFLALVISGTSAVTALVAQAQDVDSIEKDYERAQKKLQQAQAQADALSGQLNRINASLAVTQQAIVATKTRIAQATNEIEKKQAEVELIQNRIDENRLILAGLVREMQSESEDPAFTALLSADDVTRALNDPDRVMTVGERMSAALSDIHSSQDQALQAQSDLEALKQAHEATLGSKLVQKQELASDQQSTAADLEDQQKVVDRLRKEVAELQSDLSTLTGNSYDASDIKDAVEYANKKTGVPKGFLVGVLKMETNLGANVGGCTYAQVESGAQASYKAGKLGKTAWATFQRRRDLFKKICDDLDIDYKKQKVSCNPKGYTGTGGAMGVAQFMPDTWNAYKSQVSSATGHNPPSPWNLTDGVMAMALKLAKTPGVTSGKTSAMKSAACSYLGTCYAPYINGILYWADHYKQLFD
ncbi:MAG TPA: lytic murein transglycosylase [Candidatus Fimivivens sp.]|nr:lytic murein transglycosylase [Candidatus Fimivivens sp.]